MKKIKCLFERTFHERGKFTLHETVTPGLEWALTEDSIWTVKWDGSACMVDESGRLFARYDAKNGRTPPDGFIPCDVPDAETGHWPGWIAVEDQSQYKWQRAAFERCKPLEAGTYEAIGPHFQGNPHKEEHDILVPHGKEGPMEDGPRTFKATEMLVGVIGSFEGFVIYRKSDPEQRAKIRRADFGLDWPANKPPIDQWK